MSEKPTLKFLLVEDVDDDAALLLRHLRQSGYELEYDRVDSAEAMRQKLAEEDYELIISDYSLPGFSGLEANAILRETGIDIPFIIISGTIGEDTAVKAMKAGVSDYLMKDNLARLAPAIDRELADAQHRRARRAAEQSLAESEERYRIVAETASDAIVTINEESRMIFANPAAESIFGYRLDEMIGEKLTLLMPERFHEKHREGVTRFLNTGKRALDWSGIELPGRHKDGHEILLHVSFGEFKNERLHIFTAVVRDITESKKKETMLRESEEDYRGLVEATTQFVWQLDGKGNLNEYPVWWVELTGQDYESSRNYGWLEHVHPDDRETVREQYVHALATREPLVVTLRIRSRYGTYRHFAARGVPLFGEDGEFRKWICTLSDITERMNAEQSLRESEARFRELFENANDLIYTHDLEGNFTSLNRAGEMITGYTREEALSMNIRDIVSPKHLELARRKILEKIAGAPATAYETEIIRKDGRRIVLELSTRLVHQGEHAIGVQGIGRDVTERNRVQEAVRKSEAQLRILTDTIPALITYFDTELVCRFSNVHYLEWVGKTSEEVIGKSIFEYLPEESTTKMRAEFEKAARGHAFTVERETHVERVNGQVDRPSFFRISYAPDYDANGNVLGFFVLGIDITESKIAEEALRRSEEQLMQAQKLESIGRLAGGIAHDFNNMLTAINGYSDLTLRRLDKDHPLRPNIEEIRKAGKRSAELTNQLLAFSRRQMMQPQVIDVNQSIEDTMVMLRRLIGEDITLDAELQEDVGNINVDPGQLSQVLVNLVVNARDAMPDGGTIIIETQDVELDAGYSAKNAGVTPGRYVMLAVSDTGTGMDEETQNLIFEPFFTTKEVGKGTGLGLSTVYGIVKQSGGSIFVYSEVDRGTTIKIYLPRAGEDADVHETPSQGANFRFGSETILLVEDEEAVRNLSREILNSCGYNVITANDGVEALEICRDESEQIDLIMTDVMMPQMGGSELADRAAELRPGIKVLFTSGYTDGAVSRHGFISEGTPFLPKPFTFDSLSSKVREMLD